MPNKTNSCLNCEERHVGCHGSCERYLAWKKKQELVNGTGDKGWKERNLVFNYLSDARMRNMRKAGKTLYERR